MASGNEIEELKRLITVGKEKGFLTYEELNSALPPDLVSSEQIDDMMMIFDEMDIQIVEGVHMVKSTKKAEDEDGKDDDEPELEVKCRLRTGHPGDRSGQDVPSRNGIGVSADSRRRSRDRQAD